MTSTVVVSKLRAPNTTSMALERLDRRLDGVFESRLALITAPAGSGKTSLLTRLAARAPGPAGWYRAEGWDDQEDDLLRHVEAALAPGLPGIARSWSSVEEAANALESWIGPPALLIVDDAHVLQGSAAAAALERLIDYAPASIHFAIASREAPQFNLSRLRLTGELLELSGEDLRFRSWEVERLFRDFYAEPLPPEELAGLARRTEGWAAGLQLFHLATRGRTADERRRVLAELNGSTRLMREYLARNVLHSLPAEQRRFLVETSVLGRLSGALCDRLLQRTGSTEILADLERRRLFTQSLPEEGEYRYHEVLRSHLNGVLLDELGEDDLRARFRAAGHLLAEAGAVTEALEAYCRGEDWDSARSLLGARGSVVAERSADLLESLPGSLARHDPWLLLAGARRARSEGRLRSAVELYQLAESAFGRANAAQLCREEGHSIAAWLDNAPTGQRPDAFTLVRAALRGDWMSVSGLIQQLPPATGSLVSGIAALIAGNVATARRELSHAAERRDASRSVVVAASLGAGVAGALMGQPHAALEIEGAVAAAEAVGIEWLARLGRATLAVTGAPEAIREAEVVAAASATVGDDWGAVLAQLAAAWGALISQEEVCSLDTTVVAIRGLEAPVLETWTRSLLALAGVRGGEADGSSEAQSAVALARSLGVDGPRLVAHLAAAEGTIDPIEAEEQLAEAATLSRETGLRVPSNETPSFEVRIAGEQRVAPTSLVIRLLGGFELEVGGKPADLGSIRPRARMLLRLLALNAGRGVHHEIIEAALWPDADSNSSARNLHVAVAALRRAMEPTGIRGAFQLIRRHGDAYVLSPPADAFIDLLAFDAALTAGHHARAMSDNEAAEHAYERALSLYRGDLLPEDGPADWVSERREVYRVAAVEATQALAEVLLLSGKAARAARVCGTGLGIERYHDPLWRLLIEARDQAGDHGAAKAARLGYDRMLAELGVTGPMGNSPQ